jgi:hypothetical protein
MESYDELIAAGEPDEKSFAEIKDDDIAVLIFTAGHHRLVLPER